MNEQKKININIRIIKTLCKKNTDYVEANFSKESEKQVEEGGGGEGGVDSSCQNRLKRMSLRLAGF